MDTIQRPGEPAYEVGKGPQPYKPVIDRSIKVTFSPRVRWTAQSRRR